MAELGRAALIVCLGLSVYALVAGSLAAWEGRRRLAASAQNALVAAFGAAAVASGVLRRRPRPPRLLVRLRRRLHEREASARLHALGVLGRAGGLAAPLAARADRDVRGRRALQPLRGARGDRLGRAGARARRRVLRVPARRGREPVRDAGRPRSTARGSTRASRTRTWSSTRRCSISATSA